MEQYLTGMVLGNFEIQICTNELDPPWGKTIKDLEWEN